MEISDLFPKAGRPMRIYCDSCGEPMILEYKDFKEIVSGIEMSIKEMPYLMCQECGYSVLTDYSRAAVVYLHQEAKKSGKKHIEVTRSKCNRRYSLTSVEFNYDSDDYENLPGLKRDGDDGFLTPVFFNKDVLIKFQNHPEYGVSLASKTYGEIYRGNEYSIPFGINKNGKLILWLGDIGELPEKEQHYLRSENVDSDHDIGSEFYVGQIEARFTKRSPEDEFINSRFEFLREAGNRFNLKFHHLDDETLESILQFSRPVVETKKERDHAFKELNKINIESLNPSQLKKLNQDRGTDYVEKKSLKLLELLFEHEYPDQGVSRIISPLFVLYDLRQLSVHGMKAAKADKIWKEACERLEIETTSGFMQLYDRLIEKLTDCYAGLRKLMMDSDKD